MATLGDLLVRVGITGTDEFTKTFGTLTDRLKVFDKEYNKTFAGLEKTGDRLKGLGSTLSVGITAPLAVLGGVSVKAFGDFDAAMTQSLAIMGDVSSTMRDEIGAAARQMAKESTFSATQAADAIYFLASAGLDAKASIAALPVVTKFAQAGMFDLAKATEFLNSSQSALGLATNDATTNMQNMVRVSDVLVEAANKSDASVEQFAAALTNKAGAALRLVNKDIEEGVAVLAAFADQGTKGEEAGEKLSIVMRDLQNAAIGQKDEFKALNIGVFDSAGNLRNMADIVGDLEGALTGMSDEQKRTTLSMLGFQDRSVSALQSLLGFSGAIRDYEGKLRQAGGTTEEIAQKQLQTFNAQMTLMKNRLTDAAISIGQALVPVLQNLLKAMEPVIQFATNLAHRFAELDPSIQGFTIALLGIVAVAGPVLYVSGQMIESFLTVAKALGTVGTAGGAMTALKNSMQGALPLAITLAGVWLTWEVLKDTSSNLSSVADHIRDIADALPAFKDKADEGKKSMDETRESAGLLETSLNKVADAAKSLSEFDWWTALKNAATGPLGAFNNFLGGLNTNLAELKVKLGIFPEMDKAIADVAKRSQNAASASMRLAGANAQAAIEAAKAAAAARARAESVDTFREAVDKEKKAIIESTEKKKIHEQAMRELGLETEKTTATFLKWEEQQNSVTQTIIAGAKKQQDEFTESIKRLVDLREHIEKTTGSTGQMIVQMQQAGGATVAASISVVDFTGDIVDLAASVQAADADFKKLGGDTLPDFGSSIEDAAKKIEALEEPFKTLGITSAASLANIAEKNRVAYETIRSDSNSSLNDINRAWVRYEESRIEAARAAGEQIPKEQQAALDKMKRDLELAHGGQTQQWKRFTQQVSTIINDFAKDLAAGTINLFKGLFGFDDFNRKLAEDSANLRAELDDRTQAIDDFRQTTEDAIAGVNTKYAQQLAEETGELMDALGKRQGEYAAYVVDVAQKLETLRNTESERLANEQATLSDRLRDKEADYERYVGEVARKEEDIRRTHDEQLRLQLRSLQENLAERVESYDDFVTDANTKLGRIEGDLEETIRDATRNINRRIEDENEDFAKDQTKLNDDLRKAEAKGDTERVKDIKRQLAERESAHSKTIRRLQEDLAEQVRDARRRAEEQTTDLQTQLDRRARDHAQYLAENTRAQAEATEKHRTQQEQQLTDLQRSLDERTAALIAFRGETAAAIAAAAEASAQKIQNAEREADALVVRKRQELDEFETATRGKIDQLTAHFGAKQEEEVVKLRTEFGNKLKEYDQYRGDVEQKLAELEAAHKGPLDRIRELFSSVFESAANAVLRLVSEEVLGKLIGKLTGLITDLLPGLGNAVNAALGGITGAAGQAAGGAGGSIAGAAGGASGIAGGVGGLASQLTAVGALGSFATGIVGVFQSARQENTLNAIEESTRFTAIGMIGTAGLIDTSREFLPNLFFLNEFNYKVAAPWMARVESHLEDGGIIHQQLARLYSAIHDGSNVMLAQIRDAVLLASPAGPALSIAGTGGSITIHNHVHIDGNEVGNSIVTIGETQGGGGL